MSLSKQIGEIAQSYTPGTGIPIEVDKLTDWADSAEGLECEIVALRDSESCLKDLIAESDGSLGHLREREKELCESLEEKEQLINKNNWELLALHTEKAKSRRILQDLIIFSHVGGDAFNEKLGEAATFLTMIEDKED
jgi:hypothetical protein